MQEFEQNMCLAIPGYHLAALDETDIETLFGYAAFLLHKNAKKHEGLRQINGKWYKKVDSFRGKAVG